MRETSAFGMTRGQSVTIQKAIGVGGGKSEEAQNAQVVFADAVGRDADETHARRIDIGKATDRIVDRAVCVTVERVDCEVAAAGVGGPVGGEGDAGMAAIGLDVGAQCRDFERNMVRDHGDSAVLQAGRDRLQACLLHRLDGLLGLGRRRDIDIGDRAPD